jgi:hypothetical protein
MNTFEERHYSVKEIAAMWHLGVDATRALFAKEPGVLQLRNPPTTRWARKYVTLRIPASVLARVYTRLSANPQANHKAN